MRIFIDFFFSFSFVASGKWYAIVFVFKPHSCRLPARRRRRRSLQCSYFIFFPYFCLCKLLRVVCCSMSYFFSIFFFHNFSPVPALEHCCFCFPTRPAPKPHLAWSFLYQLFSKVFQTAHRNIFMALVSLLFFFFVCAPGRRDGGVAAAEQVK